MSTYEERAAAALKRAARGELAGRYIRAEVKVRPDLGGPLGGSAYLHRYGGAGNQDTVILGEHHHDADGRVRTLANEAIHRSGYRLDGGWDDVDACTLRAPLDVTAEYLDFVARRFGPVPDPGEVPDGVAVHALQRGRWRVWYCNRRCWYLTWQPRLQGDVWRLWGGLQATRMLASADNPGELLASLPERDAEIQARATARKEY